MAPYTLLACILFIQFYCFCEFSVRLTSISLSLRNPKNAFCSDTASFRRILIDFYALSVYFTSHIHVDVYLIFFFFKFLIFVHVLDLNELVYFRLFISNIALPSLSNLFSACSSYFSEYTLYTFAIRSSSRSRAPTTLNTVRDVEKPSTFIFRSEACY